jgi:hypothetical protein
VGNGPAQQLYAEPCEAVSGHNGKVNVATEWVPRQAHRSIRCRIGSGATNRSAATPPRRNGRSPRLAGQPEARRARPGGISCRCAVVRQYRRRRGERKDLSQQDMPSRPKAAIGEGVEESEMTEERRICKYAVQCAPTRTASHHWKLADVVCAMILSCISTIVIRHIFGRPVYSSKKWQWRVFSGARLCQSVPP